MAKHTRGDAAVGAMVMKQCFYQICTGKRTSVDGTAEAIGAMKL